MHVACQEENGLHRTRMSFRNLILAFSKDIEVCLVFSVPVSVWTLTAVEVDEEDPLEVPVIDECCMHTRAWLVVYREVTVVWIPPKQVELFLVND